MPGAIPLNRFQKKGKEKPKKLDGDEEEKLQILRASGKSAILLSGKKNLKRKNPEEEEKTKKDLVSSSEESEEDVFDKKKSIPTKIPESDDEAESVEPSQKRRKVSVKEESPKKPTNLKAKNLKNKEETSSSSSSDDEVESQSQSQSQSQTKSQSQSQTKSQSQSQSKTISLDSSSSEDEDEKTKPKVQSQPAYKQTKASPQNKTSSPKAKKPQQTLLQFFKPAPKSASQSPKKGQNEGIFSPKNIQIDDDVEVVAPQNVKSEPKAPEKKILTPKKVVNEVKIEKPQEEKQKKTPKSKKIIDSESEDESEDDEIEIPKKISPKPKAPMTKSESDEDSPKKAKEKVSESQSTESSDSDSETKPTKPLPFKNYSFVTQDEIDAIPDRPSYKAEDHSAINPGCKAPYPEGKPNCLQKKRFVISGKLESTAREELGEIIKQYGGSVTTIPSGRTDFIVVGENPGKSKMRKAMICKTKKIDENGFFEMISLTNPLKNVKKEVISATQPLPEAETQKIEAPQGSGVPKVAKIEHGSNLWVDSHKPERSTLIIGNSSMISKLRDWLRDWETNFYANIVQKEDKKPKKTGKGSRTKQNSDMVKAALLSGPPGVGKTTSAHLICQELGYKVLELNASDFRSKKVLSDKVADTTTSYSIESFLAAKNKPEETEEDKEKTTKFKKECLVLDEIDGLAGNQDRGGIAEIMKMIRTAKIPIICICNDRYSQKLKELVKLCLDLKFQKPGISFIVTRMKQILQKEGFQINEIELQNIVKALDGDVRCVLNQLQMISNEKKSNLSGTTTQKPNSQKTSAQKNFFDATSELFAYESNHSMTYDAKADNYYLEMMMMPLMIQENYLFYNPQTNIDHQMKKKKEIDSISDPAKKNKALEQQKKKMDHNRMVRIAKAADSMSYGDDLQTVVSTTQAWSLAPFIAHHSTIVPAALVCGKREVLQGLNKFTPFGGFGVSFTSFLGKNSSRTRKAKVVNALHSTTSKHSGVQGPFKDTLLDYLYFFKKSLILPLLNPKPFVDDKIKSQKLPKAKKIELDENEDENNEGNDEITGEDATSDSINLVIQTLDDYSLSRPDIDDICDLTDDICDKLGVLEQQACKNENKDYLEIDFKWQSVPPKVKLRFTKTYNKHSGTLENTSSSKMKKKTRGGAEKIKNEENEVVGDDSDEIEEGLEDEGEKEEADNEEEIEKKIEDEKKRQIYKKYLKKTEKSSGKKVKKNPSSAAKPKRKPKK